MEHIHIIQVPFKCRQVDKALSKFNLPFARLIHKCAWTRVHLNVPTDTSVQAIRTSETSNTQLGNWIWNDSGNTYNNVCWADETINTTVKYELCLHTLLFSNANMPLGGKEDMKPFSLRRKKKKKRRRKIHQTEVHVTSNLFSYSHRTNNIHMFKMNTPAIYIIPCWYRILIYSTMALWEKDDNISIHNGS